ncbi:putative sporulation protein YtxC [Metabacillus malikii]|uniref:Sporulation protein YtxC n=1 Tax=Metabacillus malikii TaxID=1504265 RepID=A0ABT9ZFH4_9BACI|nr:putative sporulation protein YtxC [Metabacillus malikii]MDQ0230999.1 putative sporulation protein YtxC [Metabacillus malikii]
MLEILLKSPKEAKVIYSIFHSLCKGFESELQLVNQRCVKIIPKIWDRSLEGLVIPGIVQFIVNHKEHHMMLSMIHEDYYFTDDEEQQQILHIAQSIIEGERKDIPGIQEFTHREEILKDTLEQFLRPDLFFSFASFEKFRLREYAYRLREVVEVAIEEYKLEQDYQNFIQNLRELLEKRECKIEQLSIVHESNSNTYKVFNDQQKEISDDELKSNLDETFIAQHPMYVDSNLLGPIVSIAPKQITFYTDDPFDGMVQTVQNVFQERVSIHKLCAFKV